MENERSLLDEIFGQPEENVETFMEVAAKQQVANLNQTDVEKITSGSPDQVSAPILVDQVSGLIRITHGWHGEDYVWHIGPVHPKRPFKFSSERIVYAIAKIMNGTIPSECEVKIWLPFSDWDIKEYTFKAMNLRNFWQISNDRIKAMNETVFKILNEMV